MKELKERGLIGKYYLEKANGKPIDPEAKYFILRYDDKGNDPIHISACQKALAVYANEIRNHLPVLANDLDNELLKYSETLKQETNSASRG